MNTPERPRSVPQPVWERDLFEKTIAHAEGTLETTTKDEAVHIPELQGLTVLRHQHSREEDKYIITGNGIRTEVIFNIDTKTVTDHDSWAETSEVTGSYEEEHLTRVRLLLKHINPAPLNTQEEMDI